MWLLHARPVSKLVLLRALSSEKSLKPATPKVIKIMLLATMLLLMPFPATADTSKAVTETPTVTTSAATATAESSKDTDAGQPLPLFPEAKVVTDLMAAQDAAEGYAADSRYSESVAIQPGTPLIRRILTKPLGKRKMWYALSISAAARRRSMRGRRGESSPADTARSRIRCCAPSYTRSRAVCRDASQLPCCWIMWASA